MNTARESISIEELKERLRKCLDDSAFEICKLNAERALIVNFLEMLESVDNTQIKE